MNAFLLGVAIYLWLFIVFEKISAIRRAKEWEKRCEEDRRIGRRPLSSQTISPLQSYVPHYLN